MLGNTFIEPGRQSSWSYDCNGNLETFKRYDETLVFDTGKVLWDVTDILESGETVSSGTFTANNGLGVASTGVTTLGGYATITKTGSVEVTLTTSQSRVLQREFYFRGIDESESDY